MDRAETFSRFSFPMPVLVRASASHGGRFTARCMGAALVASPRTNGRGDFGRGSDVEKVSSGLEWRFRMVLARGSPFNVSSRPETLYLTFLKKIRRILRQMVQNMKACE